MGIIKKNNYTYGQVKLGLILFHFKNKITLILFLFMRKFSLILQPFIQK